jgi:hypothetical protein
MGWEMPGSATLFTIIAFNSEILYNEGVRK